MKNPYKVIESLGKAAGRWFFSLPALWLGFGLPWHPAMAEPQPEAAEDSEVLGLNLEDLLAVQVTSVSKRPQSLSDAAAAVFVISREDLRRSGVTNIPDALRMVPGMFVASIDPSKWAVSSRGFNGRFSNKLLVLVDGRTLYSPSFSGVYWEAQDVLLEDVERIEVIRGPGATLWGANAVNGVINIITRHAADTQGGLFAVGGGTVERGFATGRYGARLGEGSYGRAYAKAFKREGFVNPDGSASDDDWEALRAGFRLDSLITDRDNLTLQGDLYQEDINQNLVLPTLAPPFAKRVKDAADGAGGHVIARWDHALSAASNWSLQAYYDRFQRSDAYLSERRDTFDLDLTQRTVFANGHDVVWGLGYRYTQDDFQDTPAFQSLHNSQSNQLFSGFLQDEITLVPKTLWLTLGSKFEHNDYTGFEVQPSARLAWTLDPANKLWASIARAVRTPSRMDDDARFTSRVIPPFTSLNPLPIPMQAVVVGNSDMTSETLIAYEIGYRTAPFRNLSLDIAGFYNQYDDLRTFNYGTPKLASPPTHAVLITEFANGVTGHTYGAELAAIWEPTKRTRFDLAYSYIQTDINWRSTADLAQNTSAPRNMLSLRSGLNLSADLDLDIWLRYVDWIDVYQPILSDKPIEIDPYLTLDVRLAWRPAKDLELSLVGQNLLDSPHLEYIQESYVLPTEVERGVYGRLEWKF